MVHAPATTAIGVTQAMRDPDILDILDDEDKEDKFSGPAFSLKSKHKEESDEFDDHQQWMIDAFFDSL